MAEFQYDLVISGAGPAGTTCAMALRDSGLRIALLDKYAFPRDKICGDFITAKGIRELVRINPELRSRLDNFPHKVINTSTHLFVGHREPLRFNWVLKSYTIKREQFDNELLRSVLEEKKIDFYPENAVKSIGREENGLLIETSTGMKIRCSMIIGADGAHSQVAKSLAGYKIDRHHYGGSVRAYYKNVENIDPAVNEVYVHKDVLPGYFWLFPVSATEANVGLGMHSTYITSRKINLKDLFFEFIEKSPILQHKLKNARQSSKLEGFGLPFYSQKYAVSGDNFLLCGDAASMIDPTNGEGITPAIVSGGMAANQVISCFEQQRFDADFTRVYADNLHGKYWKEMKMKAWLAKTFAHRSRILNAAGYLCLKSPFIQKQLQKLL